MNVISDNVFFNNISNFFLTYSSTTVDILLALELVIAFFQNKKYMSIIPTKAKIPLLICDFVFAFQGIVEFIYIQYTVAYECALAPSEMWKVSSNASNKMSIMIITFSIYLKLLELVV